MNAKTRNPLPATQRSMTVLVVGATGKTGGPLTEQLLAAGHRVRAIVRSPHKLPAAVQGHAKLSVVAAPVLDLSDEQLAKHVAGCDVVVSCLGHVIDLKGMYGAPRQLCTEATRRLCAAIEANRPERPVRFILMNTVGVGNPELVERRTLLERTVLFLLRYLLPPHRDNELAARELRERIGRQSPYIEWCSVRPDTLIDGPVSRYDIQESPSTGLFGGRPTTRANVAAFMKALLEDPERWETWRYRMPVVMDTVQS